MTRGKKSNKEFKEDIQKVKEMLIAGYKVDEIEKEINCANMTMFFWYNRKHFKDIVFVKRDEVNNGTTFR